MQIINPSQAAVQGIALLTSLKKMFMYTTEIEQELLFPMHLHTDQTHL